MASDEELVRARANGWKPKEEWKGDTSGWVDADEYLVQMDRVLPIVKEHNKQLAAKVSELEGVLAQTVPQIGSLQEQLREQARRAAEEQAKAVEDAIARVRAERREALERQDFDGVEAADERLTGLRDSLKAAKELASAPAPTKTPQQLAQEAGERVLRDWVAKSGNTWWGVDKEKTSYALSISQYVQTTQGLTGIALLEKVAEEVNARFATARPNGDKFGGGSNGSVGEGGSGGGKGKTYADLSPDAKATCERFAKQLSGPGKRFPNAEAYRKHYVESLIEQGAL